MDEETIIVTMYMLCICYYYVNIFNKKKRRYWVRPVNLTRNLNGYFKTAFLQIKMSDSEDFFKHTRMTPSVYKLLLNLLEKDLTKHSIRIPISAECRLALTLSFLSQGVSHQFLAWSFKMGKSTVRKIIYDKCDTIWQCLSPIYVSSLTETDFKIMAKDFNDIWDLPNCVGAIDGKHIRIQRPPNSGSAFFNYKKFFSLVLLATCDAKYCFTSVDVGAYGGQSDGGVLMNSNFGKLLLSGKLPFPSYSNVPGTNIKTPYFFVGDPAFPLKKHIMRPNPGKNLTAEKRIYNYRISRARVVIENTFGILVARWRILLSSLNCLPEHVEKIVLAAIALHHFIKLNESAYQYCPPTFTDWEDDEGNVHPGEWRQECNPLETLRIGSNNATRVACEIKGYFEKLFY